MLTLSDSENESDNEEIPDLDKNILIEPDIVESSETAINNVVVTEEVECPVVAEYDCYGDGEKPSV